MAELLSCRPLQILAGVDSIRPQQRAVLFFHQRDFKGCSALRLALAGTSDVR